MQFGKYYQRILHIHELVSKGSTGTPSEMAKRIGISRRMLFEYLNLLKDQKAPLEYCRKRKSYYYAVAWNPEKFEGFPTSHN